MSFFLKLIKMTSPLRDSLIIWKIILIQRNIMKMNMKFQTLKGGFLFWINLWNFHMKLHQLINQDHHGRFLNGPQRHLKVSIQMKLERWEREVRKDMKMEEEQTIQVMTWMYHLIVNSIYLLTLNQLPLKNLLLELSGKKLCRMSMMHS